MFCVHEYRKRVPCANKLVIPFTQHNDTLQIPKMRDLRTAGVLKKGKIMQLLRHYYCLIYFKLLLLLSLFYYLLVFHEGNDGNRSLS